MLFFIALSLLAAALVGVTSRSSAKPVPLRLVEVDRADDRRCASPALPFDHHCGCAPARPPGAPERW